MVQTKDTKIYLIGHGTYILNHGDKNLEQEIPVFYIFHEGIWQHVRGATTKMDPVPSNGLSIMTFDGKIVSSLAQDAGSFYYKGTPILELENPLKDK